MGYNRDIRFPIMLREKRWESKKCVPPIIRTLDYQSAIIFYVAVNEGKFILGRRHAFSALGNHL